MFDRNSKMGLQEVSTKGPRGRNVQHGWHHASCTVRRKSANPCDSIVSSKRCVGSGIKAYLLLGYFGLLLSFSFLLVVPSITTIYICKEMVLEGYQKIAKNVPP